MKYSKINNLLRIRNTKMSKNKKPRCQNGKCKKGGKTPSRSRKGINSAIIPWTAKELAK